MAVNKIDSIALEQNLKTTVEELHNYQSKLSNDFKLSAIGELTYGIVEHIYSPLQVILSSAELLKMSVAEEEHSVIENIKDQIEKVKMMINPLVKFAQTTDSKPTLEACNLNNHIKNYYNVVNPSFRMMNYECILDLENNTPTLLSNSNEVNQLLTNLFTLLKSEPQNSGGILIQTKHNSSQIILKLASTDYLPVLVDYPNNPTRDLSLMMLNRFMNKLDGKVLIETAPHKGSTITLVFPLNRKLK